MGEALTQTEALAAINAHIHPRDSVIGSSGSLPGCMQRMWRAGSPDTYNMEYGYSCMGYEVSGALGVKLAVGEDHEVYSMVGDGSFVMLHSELLTAVQEGIKINICLFTTPATAASTTAEGPGQRNPVHRRPATGTLETRCAIPWIPPSPGLRLRRVIRCAPWETAGPDDAKR